jgi:hypothetical protein
LFPDLSGSQNDINPAAATKIHNNITGLKVRKSGGIATTSREVESNLRDRGKRFLGINPLINGKARTGLFLAGSTGLLTAACFSEFTVASLYNLFDLVRYHFSSLHFSEQV